jgi:hypothetical protein
MGNPTLADRFWAKVSKSDGCWEWQASIANSGYGQVFLAWVDGASTVGLAHRVSWELHFGHIPDGMWVLHRCDNQRCVRPDHLFLGTHADNMQDMARKERSGRAILTAAAVTEIKDRLRLGECHRTIAFDYGVCRSTITNINRKKVWRHV